MQNSWQEYTGPVKSYIAGHPQISITRQSIAIPAECKQEFYAIFRRARESIIEHEYRLLLESALDLHKNYLVIEKKIARTQYNPNNKNTLSGQSPVRKFTGRVWKTLQDKLNPAGFKADAVLLDSVSAEFINDPLHVISKAVYDPLFDLLQGKTDDEGFRKTAHEKINSQFNDLFRLCYAKWIMLNICKMAEMGEIYSASSQELSTHALLKRTITVKPAKELLPTAVKTGSINLDYSRRMHALSTVDFLIYSKKYEKYIGFKTLFEKAASEIRESQLSRKSIPFGSVDNVLSTNPLLIYVSDKIQEAVLVADSKNFYLPDLAIQVQGIGTNNNKQEFDGQPVEALLGSYIVSTPGSSGEPVGEALNGATYMNIGYDANQLMPLLERIKNTLSPDGK